MKNKSLWLGFEIHTSSGPILHPHRVVFWQDQQFKAHKPEKAFHFKADALTGLAMVQLNKHLQNPFVSPKMNYAFATEAWNCLEPHHELFQRCQSRVKSLRSTSAKNWSQCIAHFQASFSETMGTALQPWGVDLDALSHLVNAMDRLETKMATPLLYNFDLQLPKELNATLHHLHSFLFNMRVLVAMDHNAQIQDPTFEALRVDSITDYLPKAEYVSNDAVLYWHFCQVKDQMPAAVSSQLNRSFAHYSHNANCLIDSLPKSFLRNLPQENLEDALYLAQMDWLLGTDAGLIFRVREELYGLLDGYQRVFWTDHDGKGHQPAHNLSVNCEIADADLFTVAA